MTRTAALTLAFALAATLSAQVEKKKSGYIVQHDAEVAKSEPGTRRSAA